VTLSVRTRVAWALALGAALGSRLWNATQSPILKGYDALGHVSYVLFLDLYHSVPLADQGWSYFHPPLHYLLGWPLALAGDASVLVRGLYLLSSAASLGTAGLAAWMVRLALPDRPLLSPLVFLAVAFVPVHVYTSPMPGNEQTSALLATLAFALFVRNQQRDTPALRADLAAGLLFGLALLTKFSALLSLTAALAVLALGAWRKPEARSHAAKRGALIAAVAVLVCAPYYLRNVAEFGTPFQLSRHLPLVAKIEDKQPPGERSWRDLVNLSPQLLFHPNVQAPHLLHSIWGSLYVQTWIGPSWLRVASWGRFGPLWLGLLPTILLGLGFVVSLHRALRDPRAGPDTALVCMTIVNLGGFVLMAYRVPTFGMLKASYLLQLSLPAGLFLGRALDLLLRRGAAPAALAVLGVLICAAVSAAAHAPYLGRGASGEDANMAPVHLYFGDTDAALALYSHWIALSPSRNRRILLTEALAGARLLAGDAAGARSLYERLRSSPAGSSARVEGPDSPWPANRLAVSTALAGDGDQARRQLDGIPGHTTEPELLNNRAALRLLKGDLPGAAADLRAALDLDPQLAAARHNQAALLERRGEREAADRMGREAERLARIAPRGFPYGVGDGFHLAAQRFMLVVDGDRLSLYRPARSRAQ
jgi:tetratricopeptide (TPR) repeat protein